MKLCRIGNVGNEKPALIDNENNYRDLSSVIDDLNPETLNFDTIEKIKNTEISALPKLDSKLRIGACVSKPAKFIGIGLNFKDHAEEQNLPIPKEPIIFSKFTSCITGPNDPIIVPKGSNHTDWEVELGFVIGKKGSDIEKIKKNISKITNDEVNINIKEIRKPELDAYLVATNISQQLEKRIAYRKAMKRAMSATLRLGAKGIKVTVSGRLGGNEIARTEWLREGSIPLHTLRADVDYAESEAATTYGIIGVKVWIYKGVVFQKDLQKKIEAEKKEDIN